MSTHELQLLEAFCQGRDRLDAAMPAVKQDILSSLCTEGLQADQVAENEGGPQQPGSARTPVIRRPPCQSHSPLPQGFPRRPLQDITDAITNPRADEAQVPLVTGQPIIHAKHSSAFVMVFGTSFIGEVFLPVAAT